MVRVLMTTLLLLSSMLSAGEFTASVRSKQVPLGKGFPLTLTLRDTSAKGTPNVTELQKQFTIHSQQQSSSTVVTNGKVSSTTSWKYTLIPTKEGLFTIPTIGIDTSEGVLWSRPIDIEVVKPKASSGSTSHSDDGMIITTNANKTNPYKNEPITYNIKLISQYPFANARLEKIKIENAIVEIIQEPNVYNKVIDGVKVHLLEFPMLITPLKAGTMVIPSAMIQGEIPAKDNSRPRSFFDDGFNPFGMMGAFGRMEPFAIKSDETILTVQEPVPGVTPWLPAASLKIEEQWDDNQKIQVGEPLTRNFRVSAVGLRAAQLPSLDSYIRSNDDFKIYSDKPETGENLTADNIFSFRVEQYTIIPQKEGEITLPAIEIPWWDVNNDTKAVAKLPAKVIDVAPASTTPTTVSAQSATGEPTQHSPVVVSETNPLLYVIIASLAILVLFAFVWVFSLQKKIGRLSETGQEPKKKVTEKQPVIRFKELQLAKNAKEIHEFLQKYSHSKWGTPKNTTVKVVCDTIKDHTPEHFHEQLSSVEKSLENALYRDIEIDVTETAKHCSMLLEKTQNSKGSTRKQEKLPKLNPN